MRLKSIKLAGFKSFVDATTVHFPTNLSAVVGPNGCGKSNVIDAVRWVMGESSAKNLRGESMTDVIFNGATTRKPVGQASIELIFDNSDGSIAGEWGRFNEVAIKRKVTRDAVNTYYINGTKCRRRDIKDIFLGTGLGPRSYAIIEQGMISKLIDAKPDELRVYIEEAAGISKYKERRRETENRIKRTRENLERLTDIRDELGRQLERLAKQASSAEKYRTWRAEERLLKHQLLASSWVEFDQQVAAFDKQISTAQTAVDDLKSAKHSSDGKLEVLRTKLEALNHDSVEKQRALLKSESQSADIARAIKNAQQRRNELSHEKSKLAAAQESAAGQLAQDKLELDSLQQQLEELAPELELAQETLAEGELLREDAQQEFAQRQAELAKFEARVNTSATRLRELTTQLEQLTNRLQHLVQREQAVDAELEELSKSESDLDVARAKAGLEQLVVELEERSAAKLEAQHRATQLTEQNDALQQQLASSIEQRNAKTARVESIDFLISSSHKNEEAAAWIDARASAIKSIRAEERWSPVVSRFLQGFEGAQSGKLTTNEFPLGNGWLAPVQGITAGTLASKVIEGDVPMLLNTVYTADDEASALQLLPQLAVYESVVTSDGLWLGSNWAVRLDDSASIDYTGLNNERALLLAHITELEEQVGALQAELDINKEQTLQTNAQLSRQQDEHAALLAKKAQLEADLRHIQAQLESKRKQRDNRLADRQAITQERDRILANQSQLETEREDMMGLVADVESQRSQLMQVFNTSHEAQQASEQRVNGARTALQQLQLGIESAKVNIAARKQSIERASAHHEDQLIRAEQLAEQLILIEDDMHELPLQLELLAESKMAAEKAVAEVMRAIDEVNYEVRELELSRVDQDRVVDERRETLERLKLQRQTAYVKLNGVVSSLAEQQVELKSILDQLSDDFSAEDAKAQVEKLEVRIKRLGPINLAAIDEYAQENERKVFLDQQDTDLNSALEELELAIKKIDRETRSRFKSTFEVVNSGFNELFPKVFGGGTAWLELTGEDLLDTGVSIMARPPGKKNSTIHLLSGGEKAMTAIALVFSIFRLNPAPFCMLDEVDAPLDDANVSRYARLVEEMSENVQFIYITHNKVAMEMAHQLQGVTMHEPGVSRLVSVDVDEAIAMAES